VIERALRFCLIATSALAAPALASTSEMQAPAPANTTPAPPGMHYVPAIPHVPNDPATSDARLAQFRPTADPIRHTIDYEIWDYALKQIVLAMGPSERKGLPWPPPIQGTRLKQGLQSRYRMEGSMVLFRFLDQKVIDSFTEYRKDLESVTEQLDISALPRNEQLAFWLNLHNVALLEQIAREWPVREPREIIVGGEPLDEARFITVRGVPVSLRDIRENIVFRHWKDPKVIYGFWRGEIGGPSLQRDAFTGANVSSLLDVAAADYVNSLRGTQKLAGTLHVASLYGEVAPFYFPDFERDVRAHLAKYAEEPVAAVLAKTNVTRATIRETDIADLHGGARPVNYIFGGSLPGAMDDPLGEECAQLIGQAACHVLKERNTKLRRMQRNDQPTARVYFSNIDLPGDPPNKNAVE
jgi:hypothetical protein